MAVLLGALLLSLGCRRPEPRVVFILLDAVRADRFGALGSTRDLTPNIDALAGRGAAFANHFTHDTTTRTTVPKLLFSRYYAPPIFANSTKVPLANPAELFQVEDREAISLPRALSVAGYPTAAISAHSWLREGSKFGREFDELHDLSSKLDFTEKYAYPRAEQVVDYAIDWLREQPPGKLFLYLHFMDTHFPHFFDEDARDLAGDDRLGERVGRRFLANGVPKDESAALSGEEREYLDALVDGSLRYNDRHLGRFFDYLEESGEIDETLIVITGDHGENLLEVAGRFDHGGPWYDPVARVPLVVYYPPEIDPVLIDSITEAVDVAPTVLELAGVTLPEGKRFDGRSLVPLASGAETTPRAAFSPIGMRTSDYKLLLGRRVANDILDGWGAGKAPELAKLRGELYAVADDPLEVEDQWDQRPDTVSALLATWSERLGRPYRRFQAARASKPPTTRFAIGAKVFALRSDGEIREIFASDGILLDPDEPVWQRDRHWQRYQLYGPPGSGTVQISFPLPDGEYLVETSLDGQCVLRVGDSEEMALGDRLRGRVRDFDLGRTRVVGERFRALLTPRDAPCRLLHFGFEPAEIDPDEEPVDQTKYEERLRALGYVN